MIFKNGIFFSLFLSMLSFWGKSFQSENFSSRKQPTKLAAPQYFFLSSFFFITSELLFRWFRSGHPPLSNLYESLLFFIWGLIGFFVFWDFRLSDSPDVDQQPTKLAEPVKRVKLGEPLPNLLLEQDQASEGGFKTEFSLQNFLGGILSSAALFIESFADWRLPSEMKEMKPLIPALQSNWLLMHVSIMILSYVALLIGCLLAISYIAFSVSQPTLGSTPDSPYSSPRSGQVGADQLTRFTGSTSQISEQPMKLAGEEAIEVGSSQPTGHPTSLAAVGYEKQNSEAELVDVRSLFLSDLDSLSFRVLAFGFPLLTLGILSGAVWANEAWGSYWSWDPKETWAFITWLIFAFYLHTRLQYGWEGKKSAFVATFGFFILWICYLGVNLLGKGLHSYGWLS